MRPNLQEAADLVTYLSIKYVTSARLANLSKSTWDIVKYIFYQKSNVCDFLTIFWFSSLSKSLTIY